MLRWIVEGNSMAESGNVASVMADYLVGAGVSHVFTYPGDPTIEFLEALRRSGCEVVLGRREGTAVFMAEGYAQATGRLGACVSTLGPGSTAIVNGVAAATWDRVPMLAISGQIETAREQFFTHQVVDHQALFGPITKWAGRVEAAAVGVTLRKAIRTATAERPGAVHLSVGGDVFKTPVAGTDVVVPPLEAERLGIEVHRAPTADADTVGALRRARRPVILAGIGAVRAGATESLTRCAETIGAPVVVAPMAKGVLPEDHPYFAGVLDMACNTVMWDLLAGSDLILAVGFDPVELIKPWTLRVPVIHVDALANTDQIYRADIELVGAIPVILDALSGDWQGQPRWAEAEVRRHRENLSALYYAGRNPDRLNPTDVVDGVRAALPPDAVVSCDVGSHKLLVGQGWRTTRPRGVLMSNGLSSMGFGLPAAIGAKLADPGRPVAALVGDGGFAMAATEMRLAAALGLPIAVVVFVDESLNRIELKQMAQGYPSTATRIEPMDLTRLAESMDCDGVRVETVAELEKATGSLGELSRPLVIEAVIDPAQYEHQF
ncbi:thiamine pyrophosphate-binding protein [Nonomuraea sp. B5E05]|uniref:thiamine pyrophosphate-binding protein n=1 Tax=Nonomuraea sp. B5E05 TaxID=3153569 RepID=UPI0032608921